MDSKDLHSRSQQHFAFEKLPLCKSVGQFHLPDMPEGHLNPLRDQCSIDTYIFAGRRVSISLASSRKLLNCHAEHYLTHPLNPYIYIYISAAAPCYALSGSFASKNIQE
jgi:hypothetical protein